MKKFLFVLTCLMMSVMMQAGDVSRQEALEKARQFMPNKEFKQQESGQRKAPGIAPMNCPYYVFNAENNGGFVIVSGDDRTEAILGYADKGELDVENAPDNVKWLLDYYDEVITAMGKLPENSEEQVSSHRKIMANTSTRKTIEPLLKTQWDQMDPYNKFCPEWVGTGLRYPAGCVAVAMAQVINYHQWPKGETSAMDAYISAENNISMPALPPTSFDWDNMTEDDIARLMLYCGQSVKIQYDEYGSAAFGDRVPFALINVFQYSKGARYEARRGYSDDEWEQMVYDELLANHPLFYDGGASKSTQGCHAFVVDGFENIFFHINWGWGGALDGYFLLTGLSTDENLLPYNFNQHAVFCVETTLSKLSVDNMYCTQGDTYNQSDVSRGSTTEDFPSVYFSCELTNDLSSNTTLDVGYGLYDGDELVQVLSQEQHPFSVGETYAYRKDLSIGHDIKEGNYHIVAIYRGSNTEQWQKAFGSTCDYVDASIDALSLSLHSRPDYAEDAEEDYGVYTIDGVTYRLSSRNGNYQAKVLPYKEDGKYAGDVFIPAEVTFTGNTFRVFDMDNSALWYCDDLTSLSIGGVSGYRLIIGCPQLSKITMREGISSWSVISDCPLLKEIEFPETFQSVEGGGEFLTRCENLKSIRFTGSTLKFREGVPDWSENSLPSLTDIYFPMSTPPSLFHWDYIIETEEDVYESLGDVPANANVMIHIPKGTLQTYQQSQWKNWKFVEDLPMPFSEVVTWEYCHGEGWGANGMGLGSGAKDNDIEYAMLIPTEELSAYKDCQITQIHVLSPSLGAYDYGDGIYEYVFITKPGTDYIVKQPFEVVCGKWNVITLSEPYTIKDEEIFVGIGRHSSIQMNYADSNYQRNALWIRAMGNDYSCSRELGKWENEGKNQNHGHPLPIRFAIEGSNVPQGAVIRELTIAEGSGVQIQAVVRNRSLNNVQSYTVSWAAEDGQTGSQTFDTSMLPNTCETITISLPNSLASGYHAVTFDIPTLDGKANKLMGLNVPTIHLLNGKEAIVVKANDYTREYGEENPIMEFDVRGLTPNGTPEIVCEATPTSPVGEYPIVVKAGSITDENVVYLNGTLTITKAPLTITAQSYTIKQGEALPTFEVTYSGFKNKETEKVLTKKATIACAATSKIPGTYDIVISGAESDNYEFTYVAGVLTIEEAVKIVPMEEETEVVFDAIITEETDLKDVVIDNVYVTLDTDADDGYDSEEKCIVLASIVAEEQLETIIDKNVNDETVKENFNGLIFAVPAGKGIINITAKTKGNRALNVKIGDADSQTFVQQERGVVEIPYVSDKDTYVYVYGADVAASGKRRVASADIDNGVLIYNIKWVAEELTDIDSITIEENDSYQIYTPDGKSVETMQKGVNIIRYSNGTTKSVYMK